MRVVEKDRRRGDVYESRGDGWGLPLPSVMATAGGLPLPSVVATACLSQAWWRRLWLASPKRGGDGWWLSSPKRGGDRLSLPSLIATSLACPSQPCPFNTSYAAGEFLVLLHHGRRIIQQ